MNIAHLLPYSATFPLAKHNGRYEWALKLARAQARQGHQVTIYAAPGSSDSEKSIRWATTATGTSHKTVNNTTLIQEALADPSHDVFHSHFDSLHYALADHTTRPIVFTQHWFPTEDIARVAREHTGNNVFAIAPTDFMLAEDLHLGIPNASAIHHGIDLELFRPDGELRSDRFIFVGRITPGKGVREAIEIARANNLKLDIVGKINDVDRSYWSRIEHLTDGNDITYLGPKKQAEVAQLFSRARALLFPMQHTEAFGQTIIEAQACGTPVIINDIGAASELVQHGRTGFIATTAEDYQKAFQHLHQIKPETCRNFAQQFDFQAMVKSYEDTYIAAAATVRSQRA